MVGSNINPELIHIDRVKRGIAEILVRWDIVPTKRADENGNGYTEYIYSERRMEWCLPEPLKTKEEVQKYLNSIYDTGDIATGNILSWAKASKVTLI